MSELHSKEKMGQVIPFMQNGTYFYRKGIKAYQNRQIAQAINYIEKAIKMEPEEPVFSCQLAIVLSEKGDYKEANHLLEQVIADLDESMGECYFFIANNYAHLGEFDKAKSYLNQYLELEPDGEFSEDAHSLLYMLEEEGLVFEDSEHYYGSYKPTGIDNIVDLLNKGDYEWAEKEARGHILQHIKDWDVYAYLAEALMYQGEHEQAKSILNDLLIKEEPNFLAQCLMTVLLEKEGGEEGEIWVKNLIGLHPLKDWHRYYLAKTLFLLKQYERSYKWFQKLYRASDFRKFPAYFHQMAIVAWKNGNVKRAKELWDRTYDMENFGNYATAEVFLNVVNTTPTITTPNDQWFIYAEPENIREPIE